MKNTYRLQLFALAFLCLFTAIGSGAQTLTGSYESQFTRYSKGQSFSGLPTASWNDVAWKGERLHRQIILWPVSRSANISDIRYTVSSLSNDKAAIAASNIRLRFGRYVKGDRRVLGTRSPTYDGDTPNPCNSHGRFGDPLDPNADSFSLVADALSPEPVTAVDASDDPIKVWVTLDVPAAAAAGHYSGHVTVTYRGGEPLVFDIGVEVADRTLPPASTWSAHLDLWQYPHRILEKYNSNPDKRSAIAIWSDAHFDLLEPIYGDLLASLGQKVVTAHMKKGVLGGPSMVGWSKNNNGVWSYDFTHFDRYVNRLASWGIKSQISAHISGFIPNTILYTDASGNSNAKLQYCPYSSPSCVNSCNNDSACAVVSWAQYSALWAHFLDAFKAHLDSPGHTGWFDRTVLYFDELVSDQRQPWVDLIHGNNPDWKIGLAAGHIEPSLEPSIYDVSGLLSASSNIGNTDRSAKVTTFYTSCTQEAPNVFVTPATEPADMAWTGWYLANSNYDGFLRWSLDNWALAAPLDARDSGKTAGDFSMAYWNRNGASIEVLSSIRLELLHQGLQDYEKIRILRKELKEPVKLAALNEQIGGFSVYSASSRVAGRVKDARDTLNKIVSASSTLGAYCDVRGGSSPLYYVRYLRTRGGNSGNINFASSRFPDAGYARHTSTQVLAAPAASFELDLGITPASGDASGCARAKAWVDWNNDKDFDDNGEEILSAGDPGTCSNPVDYTFTVNVPENASEGKKRMRVQVRDAYLPAPQSCGTANNTGSADFDVHVLAPDVPLYPVAGSIEDSQANKAYYVAELKTSRATVNVDYANSAYPSGGYDFYADEKVDVAKNGDFTVRVKNSSGANCARMKAWIDWNRDGDFKDAGEEVYRAGEFQSCANPIDHSFDVTVPQSAAEGNTRMRVQLKDAWLGEPSPSGILNNTSSLDMGVQIGPDPLAVTLGVSSGERGDLALAPYYTARDDWVTGLHIVNTSERTQVVKLRFRRATDGLDALDFNVVLSPRDVYAGFLSDTASGDIVWSSPDRTCTAPAAQGNRLTMPGMYRAGADSGYVEVIAMGSPSDERQPIAVAARHSGATAGAPRDCAAVRSNFFADGAGTVTVNPTGATTRTTTLTTTLTTKQGVQDHATTWQRGNAASSNPVIRAGGRSTYEDSGNVLKVSYFIRDNATGIEFGDNAVHLRNFLDAPAITNQQYGLLSGDLNGFEFPDLNGGVPLSSGTGAGGAGDPIQRGGFDRLRASEALGARRIVNEWSANPAGGVAMNWVLTLPGQYTMLRLPQYAGALTGPGHPAPGVTSAGQLTPPTVCPRQPIAARGAAPAIAECDYRDLPVALEFTAYNREEGPDTVVSTAELAVSPTPPTPRPKTYLPRVVNVIAFAGEGVFGPLAHNIDVDLGQPYGWVSARVTSRDSDVKVCDWDRQQDNGPGFPGAAAGRALTVECSAPTNKGVPVIGFAAWSRKAAANPNASYARIVEHSYRAAEVAFTPTPAPTPP